MKRIGFLFEKACSFENLLKAADRAVKGKKDKIRIAKFRLNMETELLDIQKLLITETYRPKPYHCFHVYEPKRRWICASDFQDRVVHHAVCNLMEPLFESKFIFDSYACRKDKGTHRAIKRVKSFCGKADYFLKADVEKYFESIDHTVLKSILRRCIKDRKFLDLLNVIIDHPVPCYRSGKGLAIGNLTSQLWANLYLNGLDHFIKEELGVKYYARYMDDFVLLSGDKAELHMQKAAIQDFLNKNLILGFKESVTFIAPVHQGIPFLGFRVFPNLIRLKHRNLVRFSRAFRQKERLYRAGELNEDEFLRSVQSMIGHIRHADTYHMRRKYFHPSFG